MRTTIELSEAVLDEARRVARQEGTSLRALIEEGLRRVLADRRGPRVRFCLRDASFSGEGPSPEFANGSWTAIRDAIYPGRGE